MEEVMLIAGRKNGDNTILYWKSNIERNFKIGDYAIVENMNGFDLIKIEGLVMTFRAKATLFTKTKYENMKNIIEIIPREGLEKEANNE